VFFKDVPGRDQPIAFCLHYLGGSAREWGLVAQQLGPGVEVVPIDLPGFGDARETSGYTVAEMVAFVAQVIRAREPHRWILVGHSMGAKVATVLASEIERGAHDLPGLAGIVTVAGSPPSPEPMDDAQREKMLGWFHGDANASAAQAREFVSSNSETLDARSADLAIADVLRADRSAWAAWLERGSREDWSDRVGVLRTSAIAIAGADDPKLGPDAQRRLMLPHFTNAQLMTVPHAKHLLPLECAQDVAGAIQLAFQNEMYHAMIDSNRVSTPTRNALQSRERSTDVPYEPKALDRAGYETLRAVVDRVVPQPGLPAIDLAARIDEQLHEQQGDGWRFAALPPDAQAYACALATLDDLARSRGALRFAALEPAVQDAVLRSVTENASDSRDSAAQPGRLSREQMRMWFEDLRADAIKAFTLHPQTLARMGYSGVANGGDGEPKSGFARVGLGEREPWEPIAIEDMGR
jgi:pimeloyl-ACP methyl ester carboxylesterase